MVQRPRRCAEQENRGCEPDRMRDPFRLAGTPADGRYTLSVMVSGAVCVGSNPAEGARWKEALTSRFQLVRAFLIWTANNRLRPRFPAPIGRRLGGAWE